MDEKCEELMRATSIKDYIYKGLNQSFVVSDIAFIEKMIADDGDIILTFETIVSKYLHILKPFIVDLELTDDELFLYKFQPKRFCLDIYNTMELWSSLLYINNMVSITEFNRKKIKVFTPQILEVIDDLLALMETDLQANKNRVRYS